MGECMGEIFGGDKLGLKNWETRFQAITEKRMW